MQSSEVSTHYTYAGGVELRCNPEDEADTYAMLPRHMSQIWAEASHASCPVVILAGNDHSRNGRTLLAGKLPLTAAALPNAAFERCASAQYPCPDAYLLQEKDELPDAACQT